MALQFSAPNFVQPQNYDAIGNIGQSIDGLFNRYMSGALQAQQLKMGQAQVNAAETQNAANLANFQQQNMGLTPQAFNAGMNDLNAQKSMYAKTQDAIAFNNASAPGNMVTATPQAFKPTGDAQTVQQILLMHMAQMGMSAQQAQAQLLKTQGEARTENQKAALIGAPAIDGSQPQGGGGNVLAETAKRYGQGLVPDLFDATGRDPLFRLGLQDQLNKQGINQTQVEMGLSKQKATANYEGGAPVQNPVRLIQSVGPILSDIQNSAGQNNFGKSTTLNSAKLMLGRLFGTPESLDHTASVTEARKQVSSILANGGAASEADKKDANELIPDNASPEQYAQLIQYRLPKMLRARGIALSGGDVNIPGIGNADGPNPLNEQKPKAEQARNIPGGSLQSQAAAILAARRAANARPR